MKKKKKIKNSEKCRLKPLINMQKLMQFMLEELLNKKIEKKEKEKKNNLIKK